MMKQCLFVNQRKHQWVRLFGPSPLDGLSFLSAMFDCNETVVGSEASKGNNCHHLLTTSDAVKQVEQKTSSTHQQHYHREQKWYRVQLGLTQRGLDDIGDVSRIERMISDPPSPAASTSLPSAASTSAEPSAQQLVDVARRQELLRIYHEGHIITSADELYHAVWDTITDHVSICSPVAGKILSTPGLTRNGKTTIMEDLFSDMRHIDDDTILIDMISMKEDVEKVFSLFDDTITKPAHVDNHQHLDDVEFVAETDYLHVVLPSLPPGKYSEQ